DWRVIAGFALYALSTLAWLAALSRGELSELYPVISLNYALALIVGWLLFGESVTLAKVLGVALILLGVASIALS
ncbi:MAG: EamA family transporter, partial [Thermofilaceae archaeon]